MNYEYKIPIFFLFVTSIKINKKNENSYVIIKFYTYVFNSMCVCVLPNFTSITSGKCGKLNKSI